MNMPDVEALQEIMSEMGEMDYEELKKRKRGMPGMTKVEIESNQPIDAQKIAQAVGGGQMSDNEAQMLLPTGDMESDEEKKRRLMEMLRRRSGSMGQTSDREMEMMGR
jgi:hypothetical protein